MSNPANKPFIFRHYAMRRPKLATLAVASGVLGMCIVLLAYVQFGTPSLADNDGYYHMRLAQIMRVQGLKPAFPWLPLSILSPSAFYDHHLLYHLYLALFAFNDQPEALILGAKYASVLMPGLACLAFWWLLHAQQIPGAVLWTAGLFALSEAFLYRMSMPRAQAASLLVMLLALHAMLQRQYRLLVPLGFVYVWLYNAFPLLLVLAGAYMLATLLTERRFEWRAGIYPLVGIALGLLINPYVPSNIAFIIQHVVPKLGQPTVQVGSEWYPYQTWTLVENSGLALGVWLLGVFALGWRGERINQSTLTMLLVSVLFGVMLFKSRRFIEYFPPFSMLFAAFSVAPLLLRMQPSAYWRPAVLLLVASIVAVGIGNTLPAARTAMAQSAPAATYRDAATWLREHTPEGSRVFQLDWDDFPRLFFYNTANTYTIGLDPTYMQLYDAPLYDEWVAITHGQRANPSSVIKQQFGTDYVLSDLAHGAFLRQAEADPGLQEVFRDQYAVIYAVR